MDEVRVTCPFCPRRGHGPDTKRKLNINPQKNAAKCFRCGYGNPDAKAMVDREGITHPALLIAIWGAAPDREERPAVLLPTNFTQDWQHQLGGYEAWRYLTGTGLRPDGMACRGLSAPLVLGYGMGHCPTGRYANRVVLPVYMGGQLVWWQARDWTGRAQSKYLSPAGEKRRVLFNLDRVVKRGEGCILLVEGIFDALSVPDHGVAMMGKELSEAQLCLILQARPTAVLVGLDPDAEEFAERAVNKLYGMVPVVKRVTPPAECKDFGEMRPVQQQHMRAVCVAAAMIGAAR
jgi:hypothetical protein